MSVDSVAGLRRALVAALALMGIGPGAMIATGLGLGRMLTQSGARDGNNMAIPSNPTTLTGKVATWPVDIRTKTCARVFDGATL